MDRHESSSRFELDYHSRVDYEIGFERANYPISEANVQRHFLPDPEPRISQRNSHRPRIDRLQESMAELVVHLVERA